MNCLIECMKMGITNGKPNNKFKEAFGIIENYMPESLMEIYNVWKCDESNYYKKALAYSAKNLLNDMIMAQIDTELNLLPLLSNGMTIIDEDAKEMCQEIKQIFNIYHIISEDLYIADDLNVPSKIDITKSHLHLLRIEYVVQLIDILSKCRLNCTFEELCSCINYDIFEWDLYDSTFNNVEELTEVIHKVIENNKALRLLNMLKF